MRPDASQIARLLRRFPRGHLAVTLVLAAATGVFMSLPQSGSSLTNASDSRSLALPGPTEPGGEASGHRNSDSTEPERDWTQLEVASGDTLVELLNGEGVSTKSVHELVSSRKPLTRLTELRPGDSLRVDVADGGRLEALQYQPGDLKTVTAERGSGGWQVETRKRSYERELQYAEATIRSSLFQAGQRAGMTDNLTMQLANIFGWDIDFILDIRREDRFRVLYEELYLDGEKVRNGDILMAEFYNGDRHFQAFRHEMDDGRVDYLDASGQSVRKEFIRTPVEFSRISSGFSKGREHPVLNRTRAHQGVDYAAPSGTPVKAAGDGKVVFAGRKGGYGHVLIIQHGQKYSTLYAHLKRFARGIRVGERVGQKDTVAYVGASGLATGPHLHYEFRVDGVHRNPLSVDLPEAGHVPDSERREFLVEANRLKNQMALRAEAFQLARNSR